jgi:hypothetical protein
MKKTADEIIGHRTEMGFFKPQLHLLAMKAPSKQLLSDFEDYIIAAAKPRFRYFLMNRIKYRNHTDCHLNIICLGCQKYSQVIELAYVLSQSFGEEGHEESLRIGLEASLRDGVPNLDPEEVVEDPK